MPKLPTRDDLGPLPSARTGRPIASYSVADTSAIGRGMSAFGQGISQFGAAVDDVQRERSAFETERKWQEFQWNEKLAFDDAQRNVDPGQVGNFTANWQQGYLGRAKEFFSGVPGELKPKYESKLFSTEQSLYAGATEFQRKEQRRFSVNAIDDTAQNIWLPRAREFSSDKIDALTAEAERLIDANPDLTPIEKDELKRKTRADIARAHVEGLNPQQRIELLNEPLAWPESMQALDHDERVKLLEGAESDLRAQVRESEAREKAAYTKYKDDVELGIVTGEVKSEQALLDDPTLNAGDKATLINKLRSEKEKGANVGEAIARFRDGQLVVDPYDDKGRKLVDNVYQEFLKSIPQEQIPAVTEELVRQSGVVPKQAISFVLRGLQSTDVNDVIASAEFASRLHSIGGNILERRDHGGAIRDLAVTYDHYVNTIGLTREQAAQRLIEARDPEKQRQRDALLNSDPVKKAVKDIDTGTVRDIFDPGFFGFDPALGDTPMAEAAMVSEYKEIFRESMVDAAGDGELAKSLADDRFRRRYGPSALSLSGNDVVTRLPPEVTYPPGPDGTHDYIRSQVVEALAAEGVVAEEVFLQAYEATEEDFRAGRPPRYQVWYRDDTGQLQVYNLPFYAIPGEIGESETGIDAARAARDANLAREMQRQETIESFGRGPNPLDEIQRSRDRFEQEMSE